MISVKHWNSSLVSLAALFGLAGCTAVRVQPVAAENRIEHICIQDNPKVQVGDFVTVMQEGFQKHGITSQIVRDEPPKACLYVSTYTARRTWDMAMYMTDAQIDILKEGRTIASANYHLKGKGGFALTKWAGTRAKILPVIDQLFAQLPASGRVVNADSNRAAAVSVASSNSSSGSAGNNGLTEKLSHLKDAYDAGLITKDEYDSKRKELIEKY
jgi:hypothetical protein